MPYPQKAESCSRSSLLCVSGEKATSSPAARNVFRFWTNAPESPLDSKCKTRKGKPLRRTIWNWLPLRIERTLTASNLLLAPERNRPPREQRFPGSEQMFELHGGPGEDTGLKVLKVPEKYRTIPAGMQGVAVNVGEAYARCVLAMWAHHSIQARFPLPTGLPHRRTERG